MFVSGHNFVINNYTELNFLFLAVIQNAYPVFKNATEIFNAEILDLKRSQNKQFENQSVYLYLIDEIILIFCDRFNEIKSVNDRLCQLERMFIIPGGIPQRPYLRYTFTY